MQFVDKILFQINTEIEKLGIDDCMGIDSALHMMRFIQPLCDELRKYILAYQFADETEENRKLFWFHGFSFYICHRIRNI